MNVFELDAYSPQQTTEKIETLGVSKARPGSRGTKATSCFVPTPA